MSVSSLTLLKHHNQLVTAIASNEDMPREIRSLLVGIATFFNVTNQCAFPKRKQISERTGYCPNYITALIRQAVELGYMRSIPQFIQVEGESAPRQIANKYEFVLEKFGLFWSKAKALLNKNLRKKATKEHPDYQAPPVQVNSQDYEAYSSDFDEYIAQSNTDWEKYEPPQ